MRQDPGCVRQVNCVFCPQISQITRIDFCTEQMQTRLEGVASNEVVYDLRKQGGNGVSGCVQIELEIDIGTTDEHG